MFSELISQNATLGDRPAVITSNAQWSWSQLDERSNAARQRLADLATKRVGVYCRPSAETFAALGALDTLGANVFLFDPDWEDAQAIDVAGQFEIEYLLDPLNLDAVKKLADDSSPRSSDGEATVTILTSGTTGKPKAATHSWSTLTRPVRQSSSEVVQRWALAFRPQLYAGLQVVLQVFVNGGTLVIPDTSASEPDLVRFLAASQVEYISATPSYWRRLLLTVESPLLRSIPLKQITLGGEVVDQPLLDRLAESFPSARLIHIYATTELGRCFSVADKQAGFSTKLLSGPTPDNVELKVEEGQLFVRSANAMHGYDVNSELPFQRGDWFATGDLVRIVGDRVFFQGRDSDIINVGGNKVNPMIVERAIRALPEVADVRVYAQASTLAGQLVACELVSAPNTSEERVKEAVNQACLEQLDRYHRPRIMRIVDSIALSKAGKTSRKAESDSAADGTSASSSE